MGPAALAIRLSLLAGLSLGGSPHDGQKAPPSRRATSPYGQFPRANDPFHFMPCTGATVPPSLNDTDAAASWAGLFDPDPSHWSWTPRLGGSGAGDGDAYAGRGIYLCGYLDVPLDPDNKAETRQVRMALTKLQVSGLAKADSPASSPGAAGSKSARTIVLQPGGPGTSGTGYTWQQGLAITARYSNSTFDVLGWDPRGVNATQPAVACYPHNADRDRWWMLAKRWRVSVPDPRAQLEYTDAMANATMAACLARYGDVGRFLGTGLVARDMEAIRAALGEDELTAYLVSYGTGVGQVYANLYPDRVGRLLFDGVQYSRDQRQLAGYATASLDNATDAWRDGVLGECIKAGPEHCALAQPSGVTVQDLSKRMQTLFDSLVRRPLPAYTADRGPGLVTYSALLNAISEALYEPRNWAVLATFLSQLERGVTTSATPLLDRLIFEYDPSRPAPSTSSTDELLYLVLCSDSYDAPQPDGGLDWWNGLWANMTAKSFATGDGRLFDVLQCRHYNSYWPDKPAGVYRGDLNAKLKNPVLLISAVYDPATPLRNGRRLAAEMGHANARLIVHHGYGHTSRDTSDCTNSLARTFIMTGNVPDADETPCSANEKPYLYGVKTNVTSQTAQRDWEWGTDRVPELWSSNI